MAMMMREELPRGALWADVTFRFFASFESKIENLLEIGLGTTAEPHGTVSGASRAMLVSLSVA